MFPMLQSMFHLKEWVRALDNFDICKVTSIIVNIYDKCTNPMLEGGGGEKPGVYF